MFKKKKMLSPVGTTLLEAGASARWRRGVCLLSSPFLSGRSKVGRERKKWEGKVVYLATCLVPGTMVDA